uniref:Retrovirus-related Pol polyprotein from transposon TNT 1-94 n=1 Tax=Cajanus cajan TaxID=3821 RepID=A0A151R9I5_CAJCA|nr:hypothetical protein KK1_039497 [Cajanus cajan]
MTNIYLINRLLSVALQFSIPYTFLFKTTPDYNFLKFFGCACHPLLRPYNTHKLDFRSQKCFYDALIKNQTWDLVPLPPNKKQCADLLTKPLSPAQFNLFRGKLNVKSFSTNLSA